MDWLTFWSQVAAAIVGSGLATGIIVAWFNAKIEADRKRREKVELIAEFLSEWLKQPEPDYTRLNKLAFAISLWFPSKLVIEFAKTTTWDSTAKHYTELIVEARNFLHNNKDKIIADNVVHFKPKKTS